MTKTKLILVASFLLVFAAGVSLGVAVLKSRQRPAERHSWLADTLNLSADQQDQMRKIWSGVDATSRQLGERRQAASTQRDSEIRSLLSEPQQVEYEAIQQRFAAAGEQISQERKRAVEEAVARIKKDVLTADQAGKYDELMKRERQHERGPGGMNRGGPRHRHGPTSRPTTGD